MNLAEDEIEVVDDEVLRRAKLTKLRTETIVLIISVLIYIPFLVTDEHKYKLRRAFRHWRTEFIGPIPLTEEQIKQQEKLVVIEAMRTVRYGK